MFFSYPFWFLGSSSPTLVYFIFLNLLCEAGRSFNALGDPYFAPKQTNKHPSGSQNVITSFFGLESAPHKKKAGDTYGDKNTLIQQALGRSCISFPPMSPPFGPHHNKKPPCYLMFRENQLAARISACKWNDLFPWNLQDLKDISPLPVCATWGLPALTFDKKGRLQLPAACQHQTVTFQTTVNFTDL